MPNEVRHHHDFEATDELQLSYCPFTKSGQDKKFKGELTSPGNQLKATGIVFPRSAIAEARSSSLEICPLPPTGKPHHLLLWQGRQVGGPNGAVLRLEEASGGGVVSG